MITWRLGLNWVLILLAIIFIISLCTAHWATTIASHPKMISHLLISDPIFVPIHQFSTPFRTNGLADTGRLANVAFSTPGAGSRRRQLQVRGLRRRGRRRGTGWRPSSRRRGTGARPERRASHRGVDWMGMVGRCSVCVGMCCVCYACAVCVCLSGSVITAGNCTSGLEYS